MAARRNMLILPVLAVTLWVLPLVVAAQGEEVHTFIGKAIINGVVPPPGTEIVAVSGEEEIGSALTEEGGKFLLRLKRTDDWIRFLVEERSDSERLESRGLLQQLRVHGENIAVLGNQGWRAPTFYGIPVNDATADVLEGR